MKETKDVGMRIRVPRKLREEFVGTCQANSVGASEIVRDFMRQYVETNRAHLTQLHLFVHSTKKSN